MRKIYDYYTLSEDISQNREEATKINISYITNWEKLHDSLIGTKKTRRTDGLLFERSGAK